MPSPDKSALPRPETPTRSSETESAAADAPGANGSPGRAATVRARPSTPTSSRALEERAGVTISPSMNQALRRSPRRNRHPPALFISPPHRNPAANSNTAAARTPSSQRGSRYHRPLAQGPSSAPIDSSRVRVAAHIGSPSHRYTPDTHPLATRSRRAARSENQPIQALSSPGRALRSLGSRSINLPDASCNDASSSSSSATSTSRGGGGPDPSGSVDTRGSARIPLQEIPLWLANARSAHLRRHLEDVDDGEAATEGETQHLRSRAASSPERQGENYESSRRTVSSPRAPALADMMPSQALPVDLLRRRRVLLHGQVLESPFDSEDVDVQVTNSPSAGRRSFQRGAVGTATSDMLRRLRPVVPGRRQEAAHHEGGDASLSAEASSSALPTTSGPSRNTVTAQGADGTPARQGTRYRHAALASTPAHPAVGSRGRSFSDASAGANPLDTPSSSTAGTPALDPHQRTTRRASSRLSYLADTSTTFDSPGSIQSSPDSQPATPADGMRLRRTRRHTEQAQHNPNNDAVAEDESYERSTVEELVGSSTATNAEMERETGQDLRTLFLRSSSPHQGVENKSRHPEGALGPIRSDFVSEDV